jgi:hypothetical protein
MQTDVYFQGQSVCSKEEVTFQFEATYPCSSDCYYTTSEAQIGAGRERFPLVWGEILIFERELPLDAHAWVPDFTACKCPLRSFLPV